MLKSWPYGDLSPSYALLQSFTAVSLLKLIGSGWRRGKKMARNLSTNSPSALSPLCSVGFWPKLPQGRGAKLGASGAPFPSLSAPP